MTDSNLKKDQYTIGPAANDENQNDIVCSDVKGNVLFKVSGTQFLDTKGKVIGEVKEGQNQSHEIYDGASKLLGSIAQQKGQITLNDTSSKPLAMATKDNNTGAFNITTPDGKSNIATVTVEGNNQQQTGRGGFGGGGLSQILGGSGIGQGFGMGRQNTQNTGQAKLNISVQSQTIKPLLLLTFAYSLPHMLGQSGGKKGMGGLGSTAMMAGVAGMLLGGLIGGRSGGGGNTGGPRFPRIPRIR